MIPQRIFDKLRRHAWPGNVRELEKLVERAWIVCGNEALADRHFPLPHAAGVANASAPEAAHPHQPDIEPMQAAAERLETSLINAALEETGGNKAKAAALLDISERSLWYRLKKLLPALDG